MRETFIIDELYYFVLDLTNLRDEQDVGKAFQVIVSRAIEVAIKESV